MGFSLVDLAGVIDHTRLTPGLTGTEIRRHCREAIRHSFRSVCLLPAAMEVARKSLRGSGVRLGAVVAFPHGGSTLLGKIFEALECWKQGAEELDIVVDLAAIREGDFRRLSREIREIRQKTPECLHKFILEVGLLTEKELNRSLEVFNEIRPDFLKTSTGTLSPPVTPGQVERIRERLREEVGIKAAGGIRTLSAVKDFLQAGASRIGTSSALGILQEFRAGLQTAPSPETEPD